MNGSTDAAVRATIGYHAAREVTVGEALAALPAHSWTVISDVAWPDRHGAVIDHVVIGPPGVFVVDEELLVGNVSLHDGVLRLNGRNRSSIIGEAFAAARSVLASLPGVRADLVQPVVCVSGGHHARGEVDGVTVCTPVDVVQWLSSRPAVFGAADLGYVVNEARTRFTRVERSDVEAAQSAPARPTAHEQRLARAPMTRQAPRKDDADRETFRWGRLLAAAAAVVVVGVGFTQPQVIGNVAGSVADLVVDEQVRNPQP